MNQPLQPLENDLESLRATWAGALPAFGHNGAARSRADRPRADLSGVSRDVAAMSDAGLVAAADALARLMRDTEAVMASVAGEVARRSPSELGKDGLAKRQGFQNPARLVAAATGGSVSTAARMVQVGRATAERQSLTGETLPPAHPHVAAGLASGDVSVDAASVITSMLDRVGDRADPATADAVEEVLASRAKDLPFDLLLKVVRQAEARLDQDGVAPREEELRADRSLSIREDGRGMVRLTAVLDPETGASVKAAIEGLVTKMIRASHRGSAGPDCVRGDAEGTTTAATAEPVVEDDRSVPQMQADALAMIARHVLGCGRMPSAPATAVVIRTDLKALADGVGQGEIDGLTQPVSAGTIRRLAATAGLIPTVLGGDSLPLDVGRDVRLFSWAPRIALAERDGGCACCGLDVAYTEAHHIDWWRRDDGPTDLSNGALLCPPCHTRMHNDGWVIRVRDGEVWFIPPPHVDADRKSGLGGKARYALPLLDALA